MTETQQKLEKLLEIEGYEDALEFGEAMILLSTVPAICKNEDCDYTEEMEPDQDRGWCPECNDNSLVGGLVLMGVI